MRDATRRGRDESASVEGLVSDLGLGDATLSALREYCEMLLEWNRRMNLLSRGDEKDLRRRHLGDSLRLAGRVLEETSEDLGLVVDLGSGGGLPALPLAAALREARPRARILMIESSERKSVFLREAARRLGVSARVETRRIEDYVGDVASGVLRRPDVVVARALAPLDRLISLTAPLIRAGSVGFFPKGRRFSVERERAERGRRFRGRWLPDSEGGGAGIFALEGVD